MKKQLLHYIAMGGEHGCLPDNCSAYRRKGDAVEGLDDIYELSRRQKISLRQFGIVELRRSQGGAYCEISECTCDSPWEHDEQGSREDWPEYIPVTPENGDYFIQSDGMNETLAKDGKIIFSAWKSERELVHFILERMRQENYYPNGWFIGDHVNISQVKLFKHCYRFMD